MHVHIPQRVPHRSRQSDAPQTRYLHAQENLLSQRASFFWDFFFILFFFLFFLLTHVHAHKASHQKTLVLKNAKLQSSTCVFDDKRRWQIQPFPATLLWKRYHTTPHQGGTNVYITPKGETLGSRVMIHSVCNSKGFWEERKKRWRRLLPWRWSWKQAGCDFTTQKVACVFHTRAGLCS